MTTTYRADDVPGLLRSGHSIRRPPRRESLAAYAPDAHVRDADGHLVGRIHESALRKLMRDYEERPEFYGEAAHIVARAEKRKVAEWEEMERETDEEEAANDQP